MKKNAVQYISHGRFNGVNCADIEAAHPSPENAAADIALNSMETAILAQKLKTELQFLKDREQRAQAYDRICWLCRRSYLQQNGDKAEEIDIPKSGLDRATAIRNGQQDRTVRAGACLEAQESSAWKTRTFAHATPIEPFLADAVATPQFQACAIRLVDYLLTYDVEFISHFSLLFPDTRKAEIKMAIHSPNILTAERTELAQEAQSLTGEHAKSVSNMAIAEINATYQEHIRPLELELIKTAMDTVKQKQLEDVATEKAFHAQHNLKWEPGKLSKRRDATVKTLQGALDRFDPAKRQAGVWTSQAIYRADDTVLSTVFGIVFDPLALAGSAA